MKKKYAVHPGEVVSMTDGDIHYINAPTLARLYNLPPGSWFTWPSQGFGHGLGVDDYIHLYPQYDGNYSLDKSE